MAIAPEALAEACIFPFAPRDIAHAKRKITEQIELGSSHIYRMGIEWDSPGSVQTLFVPGPDSLSLISFHPSVRR
jgi:hypothetical protein